MRRGYILLGLLGVGVAFSVIVGAGIIAGQNAGGTATADVLRLRQEAIWTGTAAVRIAANSTATAVNSYRFATLTESAHLLALNSTASAQVKSDLLLTNAAQLITDAVSFQLTQTYTSTPSPTASETASATPSATLTPDGRSRSRPVEFRQWTPPSQASTLSTAFTYRFRVTGFDANADAEVVAKLRGNPEPPSGQKYVVATIEIECLGDSDALCEVYGFEFFAVGRNGIVYEPPSLGYMISAKFFGGAKYLDEVAYLVAENDRDFVIYYDNGSPFVYAAAYRPPFAPTPRPTATTIRTPEPTATCVSACG